MSRIKLKWHSKEDDRVCPICKALNNHEWTFVVGTDQFPNVLTANGQNVWDVHQGSRAHGHQGFNCRCHITSKISYGNMLEKIENLKNEALEKLETLP